jgi:hypothetical protein
MTVSITASVGLSSKRTSRGDKEQTVMIDDDHNSSDDGSDSHKKVHRRDVTGGNGEENYSDGLGSPPQGRKSRIRVMVDRSLLAALLKGGQTWAGLHAPTPGRPP